MCLAILTIAGCVCYGLSLGNGFVWDDILLVAQNDLIKGWKLLPQVFSKTLFYVTNPAYQYYRPLQSFSYIIDHSIWGLYPLGFHLSNIFMHVCVTLLFFVLITSLSGNANLAFWASLLYTAHPAHTTTVYYISGRADMLMTLFTTGSLLLFLYFRSWQVRLLSVFFFVAALLSKETALIFPAFLFMAVLMRPSSSEEPRAVRFRWCLAYAGVALAYLFFRNAMGLNVRIIPQDYPALPVVAAAYIRIIASYLRLIFLPAPVAMIRTLPLGGPLAASGIFAAVCCAAALFLVVRFARPLLVWLAWFFFWIAPVISLAFRNPEYYNQGLAVAQAHWLYPALAGVCVVFVFAVKNTQQFIGPKAVHAVLGLCVIALSALTMREAPAWEDNLTFFTHAADQAEKSPTVFRNLGWVYLSRRDFTNALSAYGRALKLEKQDKARAVIARDLSVAYATAGRMKEAREAAEESIRFDAGYAFGYAQLGALDMLEGNAGARENLFKALKIDPFCSLALDSMVGLSKEDSGLRQYLLRRYQEFLPGYRRKRFDDYKTYLVLGLLRLYDNDLEQALEYLGSAVRLNPYNDTASSALAVCYAQKGDYSSALRFFRRSLKLNPYNPEAYRNLSFLLDSLGLSEEARRLREKSSRVNLFN